jgi:phosphate transport system substrate-binding protein
MKKNKNKIASLLLAAIMLIISITACSSSASSTSSKSTSSSVASLSSKDSNATSKSVSVTGNVATDGSTSMEKVIGALGEAFTNENPGVNFTYNPTGSGSGITAVTNGTCDIGLSSRDLTDDEKSTLTGTVLALDGIAIIVNTQNTVKDLTVEQIASIYTGAVTNWKDVGGADAEIVVIGREAGSGTRDGFESITNTKDKCVLRQELTSTGDVITSVSQNPDAIGYASLAAVGSTVSTLKVNGITPSEETVKDNTYVIQRPFLLVTKTGSKLSSQAQAFFDFCMSTDASPIISKAGAVPVN